MTTYPIIRFGDIEFRDTDIINASIVEEFNSVSITLPISTLEFSVYSNDSWFSILNPQGAYSTLKEKQPMSVYEYVDGYERFIGLFFLSKWSNPSSTQMNFKLVDQIGLLDLIEYKGGIWITPITLSDLLIEIQNGTGIQFQIDPEILDLPISGWIPICSYREALQMICFSCGVTAITARENGYIKISRIGALGSSTKGIRCGVASSGQSRFWQKRFRPAVWDRYEQLIDIPSSEMITGYEVVQRPYISGVNITYYEYSGSTDSVTLFDGTLSAGEHTILFNKPAHDLSSTYGTLVENGANYCIISVPSEHSVVITGQSYNEVISEYSKLKTLTASQKENVVKIKNVTLVTSSNVVDICNTVYDYYEKRVEQNTKVVRPETKAGGSVIIDTLFYQRLSGVVERVQLDLSKGFIGNIKVIGNSIIIPSRLATGVFSAGQSRTWQRRYRYGA